MIKPADAARLLHQPKFRPSLHQASRQTRSTSSPLHQHTRFFFQKTWQGSAKSRASSCLLQLQQQQSLLFRRMRNVRFNSNRPSPDITPNLGSPNSTSLSARLKKLTREYGWAAVGVYLGLSVLDFPFCFLAVRMLGTERIGAAEHWVLSWVWRLAEVPFPSISKDKDGAIEAAQRVVGDAAAREGSPGWGVDEADAANKKEDATLWTQLVLAYAIHKSFIFFRVPLTAAVTPKVVKTLRRWGWDIGKRTTKVKSMADKAK